MKNELIKINEIPLPKQIRDSHIPQVGDIYIYNYDHSIIRILSKVDGYNSYYYESWSFSQNRWIPSESVSSVKNNYYTLLLHPFEEVLKMCNDCFDNPNFLQQLNFQEKDSTSLITQGDKLNFMLEESQLLQDKMESVQSLMRGRVKEMERMMSEKINSLTPILKSLRKTIHNIQEIVNILNAYIGEGVEVKQICEGEPASIDTPISIRQRILFMDEEVAIINSDGQGLDYQGKETFYEWLKDAKHRDIVLPEEKCVVVLKPTRFNHRYSNNAYTNSLLNKWNKHSFIVIRNGENIYSIESDNLCIYDSVMPTKTKLDEILSNKWRNEELKQEELDSLKFRGLFFCMIIQGLVDKSDIFKPIELNVNIVKGIGVNLIFDAEESLGTGIKDFKTWLKEKSDNICRGSRIVYVNGGTYLKYYYNDYSKPNPPKQGLYSVEEHEGKLLFKYSPENDCWWDWNGSHERKNRVSWVFDKYNAINYDEISVEELDIYLNDRTQRKYYVDILPLLLHLKREKLQEQEWEEAFKTSMVKYFSDKHNIVLQPELLNEAVKWWKMKVIFKRPLKQDDVKSWRMIEKYCLNKIN